MDLGVACGKGQAVHWCPLEKVPEDKIELFAEIENRFGKISKLYVLLHIERKLPLKHWMHVFLYAPTSKKIQLEAVLQKLTACSFVLR